MLKIIIAIIFIVTVIFLFSQSIPETNTVALFDAVYMDKISDIERLLNKGAKLERLYRSIFPGRSEVIGNIDSYKGESPLHAAAGWGRERVIKYALLHGVDFTVPNKYGNTPLHTAVANEQVDIVRLLADKKDLLNIKNEAGSTPLDAAKNSSSNVKHKIIESILETASK